MAYPKEIKGEGVEWYKIWYLIEPIVKDKKGLDLGCGAKKIPGSIGVDFRNGPQVDVVGDVSKRDFITSFDEKFDYVFSSHLIEDYPPIHAYEICAMWVNYLLKDGGLFILYVPQKGAYKGNNLNHKWEFNIGDMERLFINLNLKRILVYYENHVFPNLYGILGVARKEMSRNAEV